MSGCLRYAHKGERSVCEREVRGHEWTWKNECCRRQWCESDGAEVLEEEALLWGPASVNSDKRHDSKSGDRAPVWNRDKRQPPSAKIATVIAKPRISDEDIQDRDIGPPPPPPRQASVMSRFSFSFSFLSTSNFIRSSSRSDIQLISYVSLFRQQYCGQIYIFFLFWEETWSPANCISPCGSISFHQMFCHMPIKCSWCLGNDNVTKGQKCEGDWQASLHIWCGSLDQFSLGVCSLSCVLFLCRLFR